MKQWKWYVYIFETRDGWYYTGRTWNVQNRIEQHISGEGGKFSAKHGFKRLCYVEEFTNYEQAKQREIQLKDFSRKKKEALFNIHDLSRGFHNEFSCFGFEQKKFFTSSDR